jgi:hypothetical protein
MNSSPPKTRNHMLKHHRAPTHNHILKRYREIAERYWNSANAARVPRIKTRWSEMASYFQELASRREHHLFVLRHAYEHRARFKAPSPKSDKRKTPIPE